MEHLSREDDVERARAQAALDAALRRAGKPVEAREPLRLAVDLAHRWGATALEERALSELRATGARPRRRLVTGAGALTKSERRIVELAAAGRQNREIADALVVTLATVEYHLRNAYRKLGIASRTKLGEAFGARRDAVAAKLTVRMLGSPESLYCHWESRSSAATSTL
jgi:DNA-binding NarL/FixJ family response regulator